MYLGKTFQIVVVVAMLVSGNAFADWGAKAYAVNFTADEQRAAAQGARGGAYAVIAAEAPTATNTSPPVLKPQQLTDSGTSTAVASQTSMPVAVWLVLAGLAGLGLLRRRQK